MSDAAIRRRASGDLRVATLADRIGSRAALRGDVVSIGTSVRARWQHNLAAGSPTFRGARRNQSGGGRRRSRQLPSRRLDDRVLDRPLPRVSRRRTLSRQPWPRCSLAVMRERRTVWLKTVRLVGAKLAIGLVLAIPDGRQRPANYWLVEATSGLEAGASVAMSGVVVGRVAAKRQRGDTTFLRVQFTGRTSDLPRSRILFFERVGLEGLVAVEVTSAQDGDTESVKRGGRVRVIFEEPPTDRRGVGGDRPSDETPSPFLWQPIPSGPPASPRLPLRST